MMMFGKPLGGAISMPANVYPGQARPGRTNTGSSHSPYGPHAPEHDRFAVPQGPGPGQQGDPREQGQVAPNAQDDQSFWKDFGAFMQEAWPAAMQGVDLMWQQQARPIQFPPGGAPQGRPTLNPGFGMMAGMVAPWRR